MHYSGLYQGPGTSYQIGSNDSNAIIKKWFKKRKWKRRKFEWK